MSVSELPCSVSCWLSRNIDPTFNWHKAGMEHFSCHVTVSEYPRDGKCAVAKRADAMAIVLNRTAGCAREARIAMDKAHSREKACTKSFCYAFALAGCGASVKAKDAQNAEQAQTDSVQLLMDDVLVVMEKVLQLERMRAKLKEIPPRKVTYNPSLMNDLCAARAHSKIYSSQFWNLPKSK